MLTCLFIYLIIIQSYNLLFSNDLERYYKKMDYKVVDFRHISCFSHGSSIIFFPQANG
jgi:hypothetical protein